MKFRTFVIGYALALAVFLFAKRHTDIPQPASDFRSVVDLSRGIDLPDASWASFGIRPVAAQSNANFVYDGTYIEAPAQFAPGLWTVDQIPGNRLIAPLVVLDVRAGAQNNPDYQVSVEDIATWEQSHGEIPTGSIVIADTGWQSHREAHEGSRHPGYAVDAAQFLVEGRNILGLGIDTASVDAHASRDFPVRKHTLAHSVYQLENVANLDAIPPNGSIVVIAPVKLQGAKAAPVRMLAMVK